MNYPKAPAKIICASTFTYDQTQAALNLQGVSPMEVTGLDAPRRIIRPFRNEPPEYPDWMTPTRTKICTVMIRQARRPNTPFNRVRYGLHLGLIRLGVL